MLKLTILSLSLLTVMAGAAVAPALAEISAAFPGTPDTVIKLILTLPAIVVIPFTFIASPLANRIGKRASLFAGMGLYLAGGLSGGLAPTIPVLLACRALLGVGVGIIMPLSTALVADFYTGEERARTMGQVGATSNLGGVIALMLSGWLALLNWRLSFGVYLIGLFVLLLVARFLPEPERHEIPGRAVQLPNGVYSFGAGLMLLMIGFYTIPTMLALFLDRTGIGNAADAGTALAVSTGVGFVAGLNVARLRRIFGRWLPTIQIASVAIVFRLLASAEGQTAVYAAMLFNGFSLGTIMPTVFLGVSNLVPRHLTVMAMSVVTSFAFLGQFLSPVILDGIGTALGTTEPRFLYSVVGWGAVLATAVALAIALTSRQDEEPPVGDRDTQPVEAMLGV